MIMSSLLLSLWKKNTFLIQIYFKMCMQNLDPFWEAIKPQYQV